MKKSLFESVDKLQNALGDSIFHYTIDRKKAAGRALGTLVEIISLYLLKTWNLNNAISIEKGLVEYGNNEINHNVEYSLHPERNSFNLKIKNDISSITATKILNELKKEYSVDNFIKKNNNLLDKHNIIRNACTVAEKDNVYLLASMLKNSKTEYYISVYEQLKKPYAIFECKRVGIEEGAKKGPQTIEKAKQGAYVARTASSLQKIRTDTGEKYGIIYRSNNEPYIKPYVELMEEIIYSNDYDLLKKFILTVGIVSNHGNWFTSNNQNKELKVLSQSYDWLLFLSDQGLSQFIDELILNPQPKYLKVKNAFEISYSHNKKRNIFTKVKMDFEANNLLLDYFEHNIKRIESWFNIITPEEKTILDLKSELLELKSKEWSKIL